MIKVVSDLSDAVDAGQYHVQPFTKTWPSTFNTANAWWDATVAGQFPKASYYIGDELGFATYPSANHFSIFHGGNVSPAQKILRRICIHCSSASLAPSRYLLCDYLGFYAGVSWELTDVQTMDNTTPLPRYTDGEGVRAFAVQLFGTNANSVYTINYRNTSDQDVNSPTQTGNALGTGGLQHGRTSSLYNSFIDLSAGDKGIKQINSITVTTPGSGLAVIVLVKVLAEVSFRDSSLLAPVEKDFLTDNMTTPIVYDGACLNFLFTSVASPGTYLTRGYCEFIWA